MPSMTRSARRSKRSPAIADRKAFSELRRVCFAAAKEANSNEAEFICKMAACPNNARLDLMRLAEEINRSRSTDSPLIMNLIGVLRKVANTLKSERRLAEDNRRRTSELRAFERDRLEYYREHPYVARILGTTQITNYKAQGSKTSWATRRKRRP